MKYRIRSLKPAGAARENRGARIWALFLSVLLPAGWALAQEPAPPTGVSPQQQKRLDLMKSKGPAASLTILPIRLAGQPWERVSEVVGVLLEQQGLENIELGRTAFNPGTTGSVERLTASLGDFVRTNPITTDYALYAEYNGNFKTGLDELRAVVVDKTGAGVWTDHLTPQDAAFKAMESRDPMTMSVLLVGQLSPQLSLNDSTAKAARPGKMSRIMDERSGLPPEAERTPLPARQKAMKELKQKATLTVFPVRIAGDEASPACATDLVKRINGAGLCKALPAKPSLLLKASQADPNELKSLWNLAREFREYVRANPIDTEYALYADYVFNPKTWEQGFVHFIVCDRKGEWVIVDMQNSHHPDYQGIKPVSSEDCGKLLLKRLESYLRGD